MEIRRIEGVLFQHAADQFQTIRAQKAGEVLKIKVLSTVPDVLLELSSSGGGTVKAWVSHSEGSKINLTLPNGLEIKAENRSSIPFTVGDTVELMLESTNPFIFKVVGLYRKGQGEELLRLVFEKEDSLLIPIKADGLKDSIDNSGIFYERKLFDLFLGKIKAEELIKDTKAQLIGQILPLAKALSDMLGIDFERSLEGIKRLLHLFKEKVKIYEKVIEALKVIKFEDVSHEAYLNFMKILRTQGKYSLISAIERGDEVLILKELYRSMKSGKLLEYERLNKAFESLQSLEEPAIKEFFKALEGGSERDLKRAYGSLEGYLNQGERWMEFYQTKMGQLENLLYRLEFINNLQWMMLKDGRAFYLPIYYQGGKGGMMFKVGKDYTVFFKLNYESDFVAGFLKRPKDRKVLDVKIFTDMVSFGERLREGKDRLQSMLLEEGIELRKYLVEVVEEKQILDRVKASISHEGFFLLA